MPTRAALASSQGATSVTPVREPATDTIPAASIALVSAQIALAGVQNLISFDEAVAVMDEVGRGLPFELRESALGGIAAAPSACAWCNACC